MFEYLSGLLWGKPKIEEQKAPPIEKEIGYLKTFHDSYYINPRGDDY
jgi:hypothetical protein